MNRVRINVFIEYNNYTIKQLQIYTSNRYIIIKINNYIFFEKLSKRKIDLKLCLIILKKDFVKG